MIRKCIIPLVLLVFLGCTHTTYLKHPETGQEVRCGPYSTTGYAAMGNALRESECIQDFRSRGYRRISD